MRTLIALLLTTAPALAADLTVSSGYVVSRGTGAGAAYMTIENHGPADRLLAVVTEGSEASVLHDSTTGADGVTRMTSAPDGFEVPAHGALVLAPGGRHVMLMGLPKRDTGDEVRMELAFERAGSMVVTLPVDNDPKRALEAHGHGAGN